MKDELYDLIIVGAGPAGLTAAIYAKRACLKTLLLEKDVAGGKLNKTAEVENYPGFVKIDGSELAHRFAEHVQNYDVDLKDEEVTLISKGNPEIFEVKTKNTLYLSKAVIIASGTEENRLKVPGEKKFTNFGVSYCAICDGFLFREQTVAVVGGGYSACEAALYLSNIAKQVYLIHRREEFRVDREIEQEIKHHAKINLVLNSVVNEIGGEIKDEKKLTYLIIQENKKPLTQKKLLINALFPCVGLSPYTRFLHDLNICDGKNYVVANEKCATKVPGLFAVGDVIHPARIRQITTAVSDGSIAAQATVEYLRSKKNTSSKERKLKVK